MRSRPITALVLFVLALGAVPASAQLLAAKDGPIVYGHHHINTSDPAAHRRFWIDGLGGVDAKLGPVDVIKFPNVIVMLAAAKPAGGTQTTAVDHVGFQVPDVKATVGKLKAGGYPIITEAALTRFSAAKPAITDGVASFGTQRVAFVTGPDDTLVELVETAGMKDPISMHHIHFASHQIADMQAWYVKVFGAANDKGAAVLPGVRLTFLATQEPVIGTKGRALDHIGFEVRDLEAFTKKLEGMGIKIDRPYMKIDRLGIAIAFLTDPWGTNIELTEGMTKVQ